MHTTVFVLLPPATSDIVGATTRLLSPYYSELELVPYKRRFDESQVNWWKQKFGRSETAALADELKKQLKSEFGVDEQGLYETSTFNESGRWDSWGPQKYFEKNPEVVDRWGKDLGRSISSVSKLRETDIPYSIVTPDGQWHSLQWTFGYNPGLDYTPETGIRRHPQNVEPQLKWEEHARGLFAEHHDHIVFVLDCHS